MKPKQYLYILAGIILALAICFKIVTDIQAKHKTSIAVSQNRIETLESNVTDLESQTIGYKAVQDSLFTINKALNRLLIQNRAKYAVIEAKYNSERSKVQELPDDSAAGLFLDRADCSEVPVLKYEDNYLIRIIG